VRIDASTVAVITGAGSGIGRELAREFARSGAALALADIDASGLAETTRLLGDPGSTGIPRVTTHLLDVSNRARFAAFADEVLARHGRVNLVVNNAGVALIGNTRELSLDDIEWLMGINFWGVVHGVKLFLPALEREPHAMIVNLSSIFGIVGVPGHAAYAASKFAVRGFSEVLRHELAAARSGVRVCVVHPGGIRTNIARRSRLGATAQRESLAQEIDRFERIARTSAEVAARRIALGIARDEDRVLVGPDAWLIERIQRWLPVRYWRALSALLPRGAR
jgi:NAD(P)-dependent dehydrogenase (short-subunit alcohol dehydrogenase family)